MQDGQQKKANYEEILDYAKMAMLKHMRHLAEGDSVQDRRDREETYDGGFLSVGQADLVRRVIKEVQKTVTQQEEARGTSNDYEGMSTEELQEMIESAES